jgi:N-methylhydantoinase A/oxoprolinase/acetone carboxylase beta subunit
LVTLRVRLEALSQFSEAEILFKTTRVKDAPLSQSKTIKPDPEGIPWKGRESLSLGEQYPGPLIVSDEHTSVWIKLGWTIEKEASGLLELRRLPSPES